MSREHFEEMLGYYQQEMIYLRRAGAQFMARYPKISQNLNLSESGSSDPHVQRLLESFAFLTGRLQKEIDSRSIHFTTNLLSVLYPQFVAPFPAASVASFRLSPHLGKATAGSTVPRATPLFSEAQTGKTCYFQTTYPVELWPFEITEAKVMNVDESPLIPSSIASQWVLKIRIRRYDGSLKDLHPSFLRFYITGDTFTTRSVYDSLFAYLPDTPTPVFIKTDTDEAPRQLPPGSLRPVGFKPEESLVPYPHQSLDAYRLLHEFFVFPNKFNFFDIQNFSTEGSNDYLDIYIPLANNSRINKLRLHKETFVLGCTPIINLFSKISEPIDLNHQSISYPLRGDERNEETTEIHTILKVVAAGIDGKESEVFSPYFSYDADIAERDNGLFWHATRTPSETPDIPGTNVALSFVDYKFSPQKPSHTSVYAHTLCTNRDLPSYIPAGGQLQIDGVIPSTLITCLERPTLPISPSLDGAAQWQLISQLSLNSLSLSGQEKAVLSLKELLKLYTGLNRNKSHPEINTIQSLTFEPVMRRRGQDAWRGFIQGLSITLTLDEIPFSGQGGFTLAMILNEFFSLYVSLSSFTELTLLSTHNDGIWKRWQPHVGSQSLL